jgi:hypothetical protein
LTDLYLSRDIPVYLVGLKSDLPNKVDPLLVEKITHLFHVEHFTVDALSDRGVQTIQNLFIKLLGLHFPDIAALHENRSCEVTTDDTSGAEADPESDPKRTTMPFSYCSRRGSKDSRYSHAPFFFFF